MAAVPYYRDDEVTLYLGDCRDVIPMERLTANAIVTDPPYGETSAQWDRWPAGWIGAVAGAVPKSASLWSFGSARMFLKQAGDFAGWQFAQEALWVKRNGTGPTSRDRLVKIHEWAYHWYRGKWGDLHHEWERDQAEGPDKGHVRKLSRAAVHQRDGRQNSWTDDGTRQPRSVTLVVEAPSIRYKKRHQDEKPVSVVEPLIRECTPPGGVVLDPFAGSGTTGVAAKLCGRRAILIEADERHCQAIAERLQQGVLDVSA